MIWQCGTHALTGPTTFTCYHVSEKGSKFGHFCSSLSVCLFVPTPTFEQLSFFPVYISCRSSLGIENQGVRSIVMVSKDGGVAW